MASFPRSPPPLQRLTGKSYLQFLFPLFVLLASATALLVSASIHAKCQPDATTYLDSWQSAQTQDALAPDDTAESSDGCRYCQGNGSQYSAGQKPAGSLRGVALVELLVVGGLLSAQAVSFLQALAGRHGLAQPAVGVASWSYATLLLLLPWLVMGTRWRRYRLDLHLTAVYLTRWVLALARTRSALLHDEPDNTLYTLLLDVGLESLLVVFALLVRGPEDAPYATSLEQRASLLSRLTFFWMDKVLLRGYTRGIDMSMMRHLDPADQAWTLLAAYRRIAQRPAALAWKLASLFGALLVQQGIWALIAGVLSVGPALLLDLIIGSIEEPGRYPRSVLWLLVALFPVVDLVKSVADQQALWLGHKLGLRARALLVGEVFAKALRRKPFRGGPPGAPYTPDSETTLARWKRWVRSLVRADEGALALPIDAPSTCSAQDAGDEASTGNIVNLMSIDSFKVGDAMASLHLLVIQSPLQILVTVLLLYRVLGWSAFSGITIMFIMVPFNICLSRRIAQTQERTMASTDLRIHRTNDLFQNIRAVKYFAWEEHFSRLINTARSVELRSVRSRAVLWAVANIAWYAVPVLITFLSFLCYTMLEGKPLRPSLAFASISLFTLLRVPLGNLGHVLAQVQEGCVSLGRIETFLEEAEEGWTFAGISMRDGEGEGILGFEHARFSWAPDEVSVPGAPAAFQLHDLDFQFRAGKLNVIVGPTGSGKTSMLLALLGEMRLVQGKFFFPSKGNSRLIPLDSDAALSDGCAYVAQTPWLFNATIRDNILFYTPYDEKRYRYVLGVCALERDLGQMSAGDATVVGENGITLSGGQKQRISLARAVYSQARHLLLDDCLSALDPHTAQAVFDNCLRALSDQGRTCVLVTHNVALCVPAAALVVALHKGRVVAQGTPSHVLAMGLLPRDILGPQNGARAAARAISGSSQSSSPVRAGETGHAPETNGTAVGPHTGQEALVAEDPHAEETGVVGWAATKFYMAAMGAWPFWLILVLVFLAENMAGVASTLWIQQWSSESITRGPGAGVGAVSVLPTRVILPLPSHGQLVPFSTYQGEGAMTTPSELQQDGPSRPDESPLRHILVLALIGLSSVLLVVMREFWAAFGSLTASRKLHVRLLERTTRATFRFFDTTPLGQLMNRFSKDMEVIDGDMTPVTTYMTSLVLNTAISLGFMAWVTPRFLLVAGAIVAAYWATAAFYLRSSRELKRLEANSRSPLFQQFGEVLAGLVTIRAFGSEQHFLDGNAARIDAQSRPFFHLWAANRWLALRTEGLGNLLFVLASLFVLLRGDDGIDPGAAAVSLTYAMTFSDNVIWLVRMYALFEQDANAVQRLHALMTTEAEQEADPAAARGRPAASWPACGDVEFRGVWARYRPGLAPCLRGVSFHARAGARLGVVGRTGAGKSTLALALFRALEAEAGAVCLDGVDVAHVPLDRLRRALALVPQDPSLFAGSVRSNLDPLREHSDAEVDAALRRVKLLEEPGPAGPPRAGTSAPGHTRDGGEPPRLPAAARLDAGTTVTEGGANLSQGQRQLVCVARALLRGSRVLVLDEATASVDAAADAQVQAAVRGLAGADRGGQQQAPPPTVIAIAHRLATVADYDAVLVLDAGRVVEHGPPWRLLRDPGGALRALAETAGELDRLVAIAERARTERLLVDVGADV